MNIGEHSTFNIQRPTPNSAVARSRISLNVGCFPAGAPK
jgi:hypothetical protein